MLSHIWVGVSGAINSTFALKSLPKAREGGRMTQIS
jgi:hypothetical protein